MMNSPVSPDEQALREWLDRYGPPALDPAGRFDWARWSGRPRLARPPHAGRRWPIAAVAALALLVGVWDATAAHTWQSVVPVPAAPSPSATAGPAWQGVTLAQRAAQLATGAHDAHPLWARYVRTTLGQYARWAHEGRPAGAASRSVIVLVARGRFSNPVWASIPPGASLKGQYVVEALNPKTGAAEGMGLLPHLPSPLGTLGPVQGLALPGAAGS